MGWFQRSKVQEETEEAVVIEAVEELEDISLQEMIPECAWCLAEMGIVPTDGSHGICEAHATQVLEAHRARRHR